VRVLFASTRGAGHFNPLVPFIEGALRDRNEVMVAGPPSLAETVEGAGYRFWPGEAPPEEELATACHGGSGTTLGALAAGLPLVVVPLFADQPVNARRVAAVGAGLAVEPEPESAGESVRIRAIRRRGARRSRPCSARPPTARPPGSWPAR
jgi:UDP:flavonoid glycosyltransferase YjiC (YdhE family)